MLQDSEKPFICPICSARFSLKAHLGRHRQTHDKTRPTYPCMRCKLAVFERKDFLLRHEKTCGKGRRSKFSRQDQEARHDSTNIVNENSALGTNIPCASNSALSIMENASSGSSTSQGSSISGIRSDTTYPFDFAFLRGYGYSSASTFGANPFTDDITSYVSVINDFSTTPVIIPPLNTLPPSLPAEGLPCSSFDFSHNDKFVSKFLKRHCLSYPFFHVPTFRQTEAHPLLLRAMSAAGSIYPEDTLEATQASYSHSVKELKSNLRHLLFSYWCDAARKADYVLQYQLLTAMGIMQCLGLIHPDPTERQTTIGFHFMVVMMLKQTNIIEKVKSYVPPSLSSPDLADDSTWRAWVTNEMSKRVIVLIRGMDGLMPGLFGLPPLIPSSEIAETDVPLPCDELLWKAKSSKEWAERVLQVAISTSEKGHGYDNSMLEEYLKGASFVTERKRLFHNGFGTDASQSSRLWQFNSYASYIYILEFMRDIYEFTSGISTASNAGSALPITSPTISKALSNWYTQHLTFYTSGYWSRPSSSDVKVVRDFTFCGIVMYYAVVYLHEDPKERVTVDKFDRVIKWLWAQELTMM